MTDSKPTVDSPCIRCCTLNEQDICVGCFRSLDEILGWQASSDAERREIIAKAEQRRTQKHDRHS